MEFRYQIIAFVIKFRKGFAKFMIPIALFKKLSKFIYMRKGLLVEEPGFKNVKNKHLGMPPF